ncbi:MAG: radical SAM protein [Sinobacteraceae bacterium]|nr:radical SAM protein [Nevskiaceae bacterium]MCP5338678.1 radical SAM protein [Nevskiaceae bacterium]MCP5473011.1 radical SAM protein [Nevskiaceae bacterium]
MIQLNTPYPATAHLLGFLQQHATALGLELAQADASLKLFLRLFSASQLMQLGELLYARAREADERDAIPPSVAHFLAHRDRYVGTVEPVIRFLQRRDPSLAFRIVGRAYLPEGPRFQQLDSSVGEEGDEGSAGVGDAPLYAAFGALGTTERARYLASLYVDDLADVWRDGVDPRFELARYGERLASSAASFEPLLEALTGEPTLVDLALDEITRELIAAQRPDVVAVTAPFPGNVYGAFRMAGAIRALSPQTTLVLGGGWVNTELRSLREPRVFDFFDYVTLDDGERPLLNLLTRLSGRPAPLVRTYQRRAAVVVFETDPTQHDIPQRDAGVPTYDGLPLADYVSLLEMLNPMHRFWSDGRWNKLMLAHGCYWKKCSFCDVSLDYIGRYDRPATDLVMQRIRALIAETGETGFHLVDEAAPPEAMNALAKRLIAERLSITWWGNIRFEKTFTPVLCRRLAEAGCVAVSGGLEVASDRLLKLMQKGVTVEQVARVTRAFTDAGIMVHAYLMYGFPTETAQETIDALERVRQLFAAGCIQSAYWHRFTATAHSPIGLDPGRYGITLRPPPQIEFAHNDLAFDDPVGTDHDFFGVGLRKALYNNMHGVGLDMDVREWFEPAAIAVPAATVPPDLIESYLS